MGPGTRVLGILVFIGKHFPQSSGHFKIIGTLGTAHCDQSAYPQTNVVAPLTQEYADTGLVDNSAYYNTADYGQGAYTDYGQYSENDRYRNFFFLTQKYWRQIYFGRFMKHKDTFSNC